MSIRRIVPYALLGLVALAAGEYLGTYIREHIFEHTSWSAERIAQISRYDRIFIQAGIFTWLAWLLYDRNSLTDHVYYLYGQLDEKDRAILSQAYYLRAATVQYQDEAGVHYLTVRANYLVAMSTLLNLAQHDTAGSSLTVRWGGLGIALTIALFVFDKLTS